MAESSTTTSRKKPLVVVADPTKGIKVNASIIAKPFREEIKMKVDAMKRDGRGTFLSFLKFKCVFQPLIWGVMYHFLYRFIKCALS